MGTTILAMLRLKRYVTTNDTYYYYNGYTDQSHIIYTTLYIVCIEYNNNIYTDSIILYDIIIRKYYRHIICIIYIACM